MARELQDPAYQAPDRLDIVHDENREARHWTLKARWSYGGFAWVKGYEKRTGIFDSQEGESSEEAY